MRNSKGDFSEIRFREAVIQKKLAESDFDKAVLSMTQILQAEIPDYKKGS